MTFHKEDLQAVEPSMTNRKEVFCAEEMVYFSPDATDPIVSIDSSKVYVIGGLVDRSISKVGPQKEACDGQNQSYDRAKELGIPSVRLPLAEYYPECQHRGDHGRCDEWQ